MRLAHEVNFEAESGEPYQANALTVRMSGAKPIEGEDIHNQVMLDILNDDANALATYIEGLLGIDGSTILEGAGRWHGAVENARVIEAVTYGPIVLEDLRGIRAQALKLGYTVFVTIQPVTAVELF